jgi:hypothetical protein
MAQPGPVNIALYDILGRIVKSVEIHTSGYNEQTVYLSTNATPSGTYIAVVESKTGVGSDKFIIAK